MKSLMLGSCSDSGVRSIKNRSHAEPNWADLTPGALHWITKKLDDITDFFRFRLVCKPWCSAAPISDPPPQLPWLLDEYCIESHDPSEHGTEERYYSLSTRKFHSIHIPLSNKMLLVGSTPNYILLADPGTDDMTLLNPITGNEISLPRLDIFIPVANPYLGNPLQSDEYVAVSGCISEALGLAYCRPGDKEWATIGTDIHHHCINLFSKGFWYVNDSTKQVTKIFDVTTKALVHEVPLPQSKVPSDSIYYVESSGEILLVSTHEESTLESWKFSIYRLDHETGKKCPCWTKISGIGDRMLFLDGAHGFTISSIDFAEYNANSIYFLNYGNELEGFDLCVYNIETGIVKAVEHMPFEGGIWFMPSLC